MRYWWSNEKLSHCIADAKLVPIYDRNDPPVSVQMSASVEFAIDMNSEAMQRLLDAMGRHLLSPEDIKVSLHTHSPEDPD